MKRCLHVKPLLLLLLLLTWQSAGLFAQLAVFNPTSPALSNYGPTPWSPTSPPPTGISVTGWARAAGVGTSGTAAGSAWGGNDWQQTNNASDALASNKYVYFSIQATAGYTMSLTTWNECYRRSGTGPANGLLQYSVNAGPYTDITTFAYTNTTSTGACLNPVDLSTISALQNVAAGVTVTFRILLYGATGSTGTWYIYQSGGMSLSGTVTAVPSCSTPASLAAASITTTTANLSWGSVAAALNYEYIVDQSPSTPATSGTSTTNTFYNATGLTPATTYYLHVRTNCASGYSAWSTAYSFTTLTPCANPSGLAAGSITTTTANLSWNSVATALNYEYIVDQSPATPVVSGTVTTNLFYNATGLTPATTYYLHVRANCGNPNYSAWVTISFTTLTPCANPTGLAAGSITTTTANLSWNSVATALNYEYIVDQSPATPAISGTVTTNLFYNATGLTPTTTYYLHVRANCGTPNYSAWVTIPFTMLTPCANPTGLAANSITTTTSNLSWNSVATALNYEYIVDQSPATPAISGTVTTNLFYNATGLTPATTYYLHVRANCGTPNYSAWVTISFTTLTPCTDPTGLAAGGITTTTANLSWNSVATALNYEYIVDQSPATPAVSGTVTTNLFYNTTGLTPATTYYLHVRANCGTPNYSAWVTISFTTLTPCTDPTGLAAGGITTTTANLSWNAVATALNYEYIVDQSPSTPAISGTVTTNLFYNATGLTPTTTYYLHVRANCGTPNYSAWITIPFTTLTPCTDPAGLVANNITTTSADLSWNTVATALNYEYIVDQNAATPVVPGTVTTLTAYSAAGLTPATTYYLHVRANCGTPNYSAWVIISFTTLVPCPDPTGLTANNLATTSADLSWNTIVTALNYEYIVDQNPATPVVQGTVTTNTTYSATGLSPSTTYYLHLRSNCGTPNYSAWVTIPFTTLTPCPDPTGLAANNLTTTTADLSWNTIVTALNYEYIVDQNPATPAVPGTVNANPSYNATGLTPATTYYLHVRANCGTPNYSAWVTISFTTLTPCSDPTGLAAVNITTTGADLSWNAIASALNYEYIVDQNPATPAVPGTVTAAISYSATGLTPGTTYYLHVRANCGTPNYSAWVTVSFATPLPCADPTGLTASLLTNNTARLSWDSLVGPSYEYVLDLNPAAPAVAGTPQANTAYDATGLAPATIYYLHVRTNCGGGNLSNWVTMTFTTMATPANILVGWDVNGLSDYGPSVYAPTVVPPPANVTAGGLTRGANITVPALAAQATDNAWGGMNFYGMGGPYVPNVLQDCIDNNAFLYFKVKSQTGYTLSLSSFDMFFGRYGLASPSGITVQYGIDSANFVDLGTAVHPDTPVNDRYSFPTIDLSGIAALQQVTSGHTVYFRIIPVQSDNDTSTAAWFVYNGNTDPLLYQGSDIFLRGSWDVALPMQLLSFTGFAGKGANDGNILNWTTTNEQGIKDFGLERSYNAKAFDIIATLSPKGNNTTQSVYQYIDKTAGSARSFYRLKITDLNGSQRHSNVVEITNHSNGNISVYPNPVHDKLYISAGNADIDAVRITDMIGKTWEVKASAQPGMLTLDVSGLPNAVYTLQFSGAGMDKPQTVSFVKQ